MSNSITNKSHFDHSLPVHSIPIASSSMFKNHKIVHLTAKNLKSKDSTAQKAVDYSRLILH